MYAFLKSIDENLTKEEANYFFEQVD